MKGVKGEKGKRGELGEKAITCSNWVLKMGSLPPCELKFSFL